MTDIIASRRELLLASGGLVFAGATRCSDASVQQPDPAKDLIFRTTEPRNGEPALEKLVKSWITPTEHFYVRSHAPNPQIDATEYRLTVEGLVRNPLTLSLSDLAGFPRHHVTATLTCAGNRRSEYNAEGKVGGVQWEAGAIGNAKWSGYSLADVLRKAELLEGAQHVWFDGLDEIQRSSGVIPFGASIPIEKAMSQGDIPGAILADNMNGSHLTPDHGYPLRTVVPGYIGARSVKWLGRIVVSDRPSDNHYVAHAYKIVKSTEPVDWAEAGPIYRFPVNAAICTPSAGTKLPPGEYELTGYVLPSGRAGAQVKRVFVMADDERKFRKATLTGKTSPYCWNLWKAKVPITGQTKELVLRAEDSEGGFMPYRVPWNAKGYLQNSWFRLPVGS